MELSYPDGSPADGVTVQIRAELTPKDNIYTTESVSRGGLVGFEIPSIPTSAQHVWLEVGESLDLCHGLATWADCAGDAPSLMGNPAWEQITWLSQGKAGGCFWEVGQYGQKPRGPS